ncbi:MAG: heparinase II/III family protein [Cypionkella sp.]|nr:heparinase II/III family protein [Cypionkella sp.]
MAAKDNQEESGFGARLAMWRARRAPAAKGFVSQPEPHSIGLYARGKQLVAGNFFVAGHLITAPNTAIWDIAIPRLKSSQTLPDERAGFAWLDDLAAVGDVRARNLAQEWTFGWIKRFSTGKGAGWSADLTGRRLIRWVNHAPFLLAGRKPDDSARFFAEASAQVVYLARCWPKTAPGLARIEALTGLIYAGLALEGLHAHVAAAETALARECEKGVGADGSIKTRNPEELLEVFTLLTWAEHAMADVGRPPPRALSAAIERIAPALRLLRHADGGLARFHGGGRGSEGRLDQSLSAAGIKAAGFAGPAFAMGYARLSSGRTSMIVDADSPPMGDAGRDGHASTAAFELTSGRRPLIVSCGSGRPFGADWWRAGRATVSHSALSIEGSSSSRMLDNKGRDTAGSYGEVARVLGEKHAALADGLHLSLSHDGWSKSHGLTHTREFWLTADGRKLSGLDRLAAQSDAEKRRLDRMLSDHWVEGIGTSIRFHLHPDVDATLDLGGKAVSLALKSGELWVFQHDGRGTLSLEPSIYLEKSRLRPRQTQQIVLTVRLRENDTRIGWTFGKAQDTPLAIRDVAQDDDPAAF